MIVDGSGLSRQDLTPRLLMSGRNSPDFAAAAILALPSGWPNIPLRR